MPKKEFIYDNSNTTQNSKQLAILKQNFPNCFDKDGNFISHKMEKIVGSAGLELSKESYSINWLGKSYARLLANENPRTLLKEDKVHNAKEENKNSENLLIKGDNLEVLKHLSNAYSESIKMIYIDPPYNTGSDGFVYSDDRKFTKEELSRLAGIELDEAQRILEFTSSKSNSHSAWLTFMYPRLYVARELLREDGVIFISIDDNEVAQLKMLCDEVFGEENFVGQLIWKKRVSPANDSQWYSSDHEYILIYAKNKDEWSPNKTIRTKEHNKYYKNNDNDERGAWNSSAYTCNKSRAERPNLYYGIINPYTKEEVFPSESAVWAYSKETHEEHVKNNLLYWGKDGTSKAPRKKQFLSEAKPIVPRSIWDYSEVGSTQSATLEIKSIFESNPFIYPKPIGVLKKAIYQGTQSNDIILDFFAGSGTTAHAVMALNAQDGGNRKFITVQIPEKTDKKSEAFKAGYKTIFDITKARIEKASKKIQQSLESEALAPNKANFGFKIFETTPIFDGYLDEIEELNTKTTLFNANTLNSEEIDTLVTTWRAYDGMLLTDSLDEIMLGEYTAHYGANTLYFMNEGFNIEALQAFIEKLDNDKEFEPSKLVIFGYNFDSKHQLELKEALKNYTNKKSIELDMVVRY